MLKYFGLLYNLYMNYFINYIICFLLYNLIFILNYENNMILVNNYSLKQLYDFKECNNYETTYTKI